jgi:hypothetical protein
MTAEYQKKYRSKPENIAKHTEWWRKYRKTDKYKLARKEQRAKVKDKLAEERQKQKKEVFDAMGGKCIKCGFSDYRALQIEHVNGDGYKDKPKNQRGYGHNYYIKVLLSFINKEGRYQLFCANCNWIKRFDNKEHLARK